MTINGCRSIYFGSSMNDQLLKQGVGALVYSTTTNRYLFLLRNGAKYSGTWGMVGGKIEGNERVIVALNREIIEEIGVDLSHNKTIPIETFTSADRHFIYYSFVIVVEHEFIPALNHEHRGYCWVNIKDHPKPLHPGVWKTFNFKSVISKIDTLEHVLRSH